MADIELVIKIPEDYYKEMKTSNYWWSGLKNCVMNGVQVSSDNTVVVDCAHICEDCKYQKLSPYKEPCESCSIKDLDMTTFIDNFEPKEE